MTKDNWKMLIDMNTHLDDMNIQLVSSFELWTYFASCFTVSNVSFELVNVGKEGVDNHLVFK